ncbi:uncharacterized protein LOC110259698 [Sus scrofa]|uniref:uncharacterized protein LOC110259698 n=1 Tax=Sus scrofa TaxID=9823 RepID=UPI000A2B707E|nr:uncharacterized protein LOC110259698 [Sus scrofa]
MHLLFAAEVTWRQKTALYGSHLLPSRERRELTSRKRKSGLHSKIQVEKETHVLTAPEHAAPYTGSMHFSTVDGPWELMEQSYCLRHRVAILMIQPNLTALFSVPDQHAKESPAGSGEYEVSVAGLGLSDSAATYVSVTGTGLCTTSI